jgi:hypothetical protein
MPNNEATERKHTTKLLMGVAGISLVIGFGSGYALSGTKGCYDANNVWHNPCPWNLSKVPEATEQLKATNEQLKATDEQLKTIHEQFKEAIGKLGG